MVPVEMTPIWFSTVCLIDLYPPSFSGNQGNDDYSDFKQKDRGIRDYEKHSSNKRVRNLLLNRDRVKIL